MIYDLIAIGAGPAGSVTARTVASAGFRVLLLEKNKACRSPCAGYISNSINFQSPDSIIIQSRISRMRVYFPDLSHHDFELNGFVVDRSSYDMELVRQAKESGANVRWNSRVTEINRDGVKFVNGNAYGRIIIGTDGVFSRTALLLGLGKQNFALCAQYHLKGISPLSRTCEIFFNNDHAPGGYAWIYPTGEDSAKVGVGITKGDPHKYLDHFINTQKGSGRLDGKKTECITGALPTGGLRDKLVFGNIMLAGDSAGMADPVTGAGINNAILAGEIAGRSIIDALEKNDLALLLNYEKKIRKLLGKPLGRALEKRKRLDFCSTNEDLQEHLPEFWVTFKKYWE